MQGVEANNPKMATSSGPADLGLAACSKLSSVISLSTNVTKCNVRYTTNALLRKGAEEVTQRCPGMRNDLHTSPQRAGTIKTGISALPSDHPTRPAAFVDRRGRRRLLPSGRGTVTDTDRHSAATGGGEDMRQRMSASSQWVSPHDDPCVSRSTMCASAE